MKVEIESEDLVKLLSKIRYGAKVFPEVYHGKACHKAEIKQLKIFARGDGADDALENLTEARKQFIRNLVEKGQLPPLPGPEAIWGIMWGEWPSQPSGSNEG